MRKYCLHIVVCLLMLAQSMSAYSQQASARVDREKILLGEQLILELKLENVPVRQVNVDRWFNFPDTFNHLEIINRSKIDTIDVNGSVTYIQNITITGFDSGRWQIPAATAFVTPIGSDRANSLPVQAITIDVLPVDVSEMKDYHPIKDILDVNAPSEWWIWIAIGVGSILLLLLIMWLVRKYKNRKPAIKVPAKTALQEALHGLTDLKEKEISDNKVFYSTLENIYRQYFHRKLSFNAHESTMEELMLRLKVEIQSIDHQSHFFQLMRMIAAVKFAKFQPPVAERNNAIDIVAETLKYVDQSKGGSQ